MFFVLLFVVFHYNFLRNWYARTLALTCFVSNHFDSRLRFRQALQDACSVAGSLVSSLAGSYVRQTPEAASHDLHPTHRHTAPSACWSPHAFYWPHPLLINLNKTNHINLVAPSSLSTMQHVLRWREERAAHRYIIQSWRCGWWSLCGCCEILWNADIFHER